MKIILGIVVVVIIIGICVFLYMRNLAKHSPSIIDNEYDRQFEESTTGSESGNGSSGD